MKKISIAVGFTLLISCGKVNTQSNLRSVIETEAGKSDLYTLNHVSMKNLNHGNSYGSDLSDVEIICHSSCSDALGQNCSPPDLYIPAWDLQQSEMTSFYELIKSKTQKLIRETDAIPETQKIKTLFQGVRDHAALRTRFGEASLVCKEDGIQVLFESTKYKADFALLPDERNAVFKSGYLPSIKKSATGNIAGYFDSKTMKFHQVVDAPYAIAHPFSGDRAIVEVVTAEKNFERWIIDTNLKLVAKIRPVVAVKLAQNAIVNSMKSHINFGTKMPQPSNAIADFEYFNEGFLVGTVYNAERQYDEYVVIDKNGKETKFPWMIYPAGQSFAEGLIATRGVYDFNYARPDASLGFTIQKINGKEPYRAYPFSDGLARVAYLHEVVYLDHSGQLAFQDSFLSGQKFSGGVALVQLHDWSQAFIDKNGATLAKFPRVYGTNEHVGKDIVSFDPLISGDYPHVGSVAARDSGRNIPPERSTPYIPSDDNGLYVYPENEMLPVFKEGLIRSYDPQNRGRFNGFVDSSGSMVLPADKHWNRVRPFSEGLAPVRVKGTYASGWGFVDRSGKEVIGSNYREVAPFSEGLGVVTKQVNGIRTFFAINKDGKETDLSMPSQ